VQNIPYVNHIKYLGVISDRKIRWRLHIEMTEAMAFTTLKSTPYSKMTV
jgi:hypothetical protein